MHCINTVFFFFTHILSITYILGMVRPFGSVRAIFPHHKALNRGMSVII